MENIVKDTVGRSEWAEKGFYEENPIPKESGAFLGMKTLMLMSGLKTILLQEERKTMEAKPFVPKREEKAAPQVINRQAEGTGVDLSQALTVWDPKKAGGSAQTSVPEKPQKEQQKEQQLVRL